jgi:hypothetical protein
MSKHLNNEEKPSLSSKAKAWLEKEIKKDPKIGSLKLARKINQERNIKVSDRTVRNVLVSLGLHGRISCSKPLLREINIKKDLNLPSNIYGVVKNIGTKFCGVMK